MHHKISKRFVWATFGKTEIEIVLIKGKRYEARIQWHDKVFIASNGKKRKVQNIVAKLALQHAFGVEMGHSRRTVETIIFEKAGTKANYGKLKN